MRTPFANELTWSKSRDNLFRECRRAYYLNHYGAWGGWDADAPEAVRELYLMKNLQTRPTWIGSAVHEVAERAIKGLRDGRAPTAEEAHQQLDRKLRRDLEDSKAGRYRRNPKRILGLQEHYYAEDGGNIDWEEAISTALGCVATFFESAAWKRLVATGGRTVRSVEDLDSFLVDGVKVWVKLDLAVDGKDGNVVIVDWKTGQHHQKEDVDLQLGIYGLYGARVWGISPDRIVAFDLNLRDGQQTTHPIDEATLAVVERYISESIREMKAPLDDAQANTASIEAFPMTEERWRCRRCRFRRACGREAE